MEGQTILVGSFSSTDLKSHTYMPFLSVVHMMPGRGGAHDRVKCVQNLSPASAHAEISFQRTRRASPEWGMLSSHDDSVVWVCYLILSQLGQEEKFLMQKGILLGQRNFETFVLCTSVYFFVRCPFEVCDQEMYVFSKKKSGGVPGGPLTDCSEICFL